MDIQEMHNLFRVLGQQMGLQMVRAILPESIDEYLNDSIMEIVRSIVLTNTQTVFQDRVTVQDNPISELNSIRTLFKQAEITSIPDSYKIDASTKVTYCMFYTSFDVEFDDGKVYKARLVETEKVHSVLNDYCSRASKEHPVITYIGDDIFKLYTDNNKPISVFVNYIKLPNVVNYNTNENCDLPEHLHHQVVENAVNKFFQSVGSTAHNANQN